VVEKKYNLGTGFLTQKIGLPRYARNDTGKTEMISGRMEREKACF